MSAVLTPITAADPLAEAVEVYIAAKRREDLAKKQRIEAEERILAMHPARQEGAATIEVAGYKLTLTGKLSYKCEDPKALAQFCAGAGWPSNWVPVKTKVELDDAGCKYLREKEPAAWAQIAPFITAQPAKTTVSVKV